MSIGFASALRADRFPSVTDVLLRAPGSSAPFTPASLPNLALWLDASDASTFTYSSGSVVSQWNDKSSNGYHVTQGTVSNQPGRTGSQNGLATVVFDGSNDYLERSDPANLDLGTKNLAMFVVAKFNTGAGSTGTVIAKTQAFATPDGRWALYRDAGTLTAQYDIDTGASASASAASDSSTSYRLLSTVLDRSGGTHALRVNRSTVNTASFTDPGTSWDTGAPFRVGAYGGTPTGTEAPFAGYYLNGAVAEVVVYTTTTALSTADRDAVESYLRTKWGTT